MERVLPFLMMRLLVGCDWTMRWLLSTTIYMLAVCVSSLLSSPSFSRLSKYSFCFCAYEFNALIIWLLFCEIAAVSTTDTTTKYTPGHQRATHAAAVSRICWRKCSASVGHTEGKKVGSTSRRIGPSTTLLRWDWHVKSNKQINVTKQNIGIGNVVQPRPHLHHKQPRGVKNSIPLC